MLDQAPVPRLPHRFLLKPRGQRRLVSIIGMPEIVAMLFDLRIVVGAVHQVVEAGDPRPSYRGERYGELAGMHRCCSDYAAMGISPSAVSMCSL